ncbi:MAG: hypothetical protein HYX90_06185 [Chloroflexi bacterium]|nr:hypothetical protein [Chloroflexota bacterium]
MRKRSLWVLSGGLTAALVLLLACSSAATPTPAPTAKPTAAPVSFAEKTVTMIIPAVAGGGTDIIGRVYARYLGRFIPGSPAVIVRNIPGGDGTIAANYAYGAKPDGLTAFVSGGSGLIAQLVGSAGVNYDVLKMRAIIATAGASTVYTKPSVVDKPENILKAKGLIFGGMAGSLGYVFVVSKELLNFPAEKVVLAYTGSADARRGFLAGETNTSSDSGPSYTSAIVPLVQKGQAVPLFQSGIIDEKGNLVRDPGLPAEPDLMTVKELYEKVHGKSPSGIVWEAFLSLVAATRNYQQVLLLPPGTPDNVVRIYWEAAERMLKDADFRAAVDPLQGKGVRWMAGESFDKEFKQNFVIKPEIRAWLRDTMSTKYGVVIG